MSVQLNPLAQLLLLAQANSPIGAALFGPPPGYNMLPRLGEPVPQEKAQLQPMPPAPAISAPDQTRGEAATAVRPDVGSLLVGG